MAAGLGFKTFTTGEVLTAADVNGYLMQGVLVFASEAARDAAITSPQEGQFAYTKDNNSLWYYTGSAWAASGATGDIEGVTAGVGISGGGTSGTVTITNSMATAIDAKGDLVVGTGADTFSRLAVGTNGYTLVADSAETTGLKWAAASTGSIVQVVGASHATSTSTASSTYADTGLTATITPTSASNNILVLVSLNGCMLSGGTSCKGNYRLMRGATSIQQVQAELQFNRSTGSGDFSLGSISTCYLDSPATTSATTYKMQLASADSSGDVYAQRFSSRSTILLMEVKP